MRASATSKTAPPANYFVSQAKADANKADEASPFALLVTSIASQDSTKNFPKDTATPQVKDATQSEGQPRADKADTAQDSQAAEPQPSQAPQSAIQPAKPTKQDKGKESGPVKTGDDVTLLAPDAVLPPVPQPDQPIVPPPVSVPAQAAIVLTSDDQAEDVSVDAAAPPAKLPADTKAARPTLPAPLAFDADDSEAAADAESAAPSLPNSQSKAPASLPLPQKPVVAATQNQVSDLPDGESSEASESASQPASPLPETAANSTPPASSVKSAQAPIAAGKPVTTDADVESQIPQSTDSKSRASATGIEHAAPHSAAARATLTNPGSAHRDSDEAFKNNSFKNDAAKSNPAQTDIAAASEIQKNDAPKSDDVKVQPDIQNLVNSAKSAPLPAAAAIDAVNAIAAPQALASPVATAAAPAHVQVSVQPPPDLPALAVQIAAKSQSGAKQFDIRLDPPELGRVEVRLSIDATGKASAHLSADQPQTLSLLQKDAPILTRALRDAGLDVSQNGLNFSLRQQGENFNGSAGGNARRPRGLALTASIRIDAGAAGSAYRAPLNGRLDIRV